MKNFKLLIIITLVLIGIITSIFFSNELVSIVEPFHVGACKILQKTMLEKLKSPASAEFQDCSDATYKITDERIIIDTYVDSQNGFGALLRSKIHGELQNINGIWLPDYKVFGDEVYIPRGTAQRYANGDLG